MINHAKYDQCSMARDKMEVLHKVDFNKYLESFSKEMTYIYRLKGGAYCAICDATLQSYFDGDKDRIFYSEDFCRNLLMTS